MWLLRNKQTQQIGGNKSYFCCTPIALAFPPQPGNRRRPREQQEAFGTELHGDGSKQEVPRPMRRNKSKKQKRFFGFKIEWRCGSGCQSLLDFPPSKLFQEDAGSHENAGEVGWELQTAIRLSLCYAISKHKHKHKHALLFCSRPPF